MKNVKKCRDVWQFYPLLSRLKAEDENTFRSYVEEHFVDDVHDSIYAMFEGGVINDPAQTVITEVGQTVTPETEQKPTGVEVEIQGRTSRPSNTELSEVVDVSAIALGDVWLRKATSEFKRRLVSASIIDIETGTIIDANGASGVGGSTGTVLNDNISAYKLELLNKVAKFLGIPEVQTVEDALATSTENPTLSTWEYILQQFGAHPGDNSIGYKNALGATVVLRRFDAWLETNAPYIQIRTPYKNSSMLEPNRYVYQGPRMKMYQNFSSDEYMDATKYGLSDVVKIILEAFPEYDNNGNPLPGTQIGVNGLYSIGSKIKDVMQAEHKDLWYIGVDRFSEVDAEGNSKIFGIYDKLMKTVGTKENPHITSLTTKYNGLKKLMSTLPIELKRLFSHTIDKVVSSEYRAVELSESKHTEYDKGGYKRTIVEHGGRAKNYRERPTTTMKTYLSSCVNGAALMLRQNADRAKLLEKHNIVVDGQNIYINGKPFIGLSGGQIRRNTNVISESDFLKIVADILHYPITAEYSETAQFYKVQTAEKSRIVYDWAPLVAMALINGCHNGQFIPIPDGQLQQVAKVLSVMNGSEAATVIKNHEGNNLPMHQVTCLAYRHLDIHRYHEQAENNDRVKNNIIYQNIDKVLTPQCRTDTIDSEGHSVSFSKMNAVDALGFSLVFDFWKPLHDHTDKDNYGKIALQATTYADKGKQPQQVFDVSRDWIFKDKDDKDEKINLRNILAQICAGDTSAFNKLKDIWRRVEKAQMDITVKQIVDDYNKVFGQNFETLSDVNSFIEEKGLTVEQIREAFLTSKKASFIENFHAVKFAGKVQVNECITEFNRVLNNDKKWDSFVSKHLDEFENTIKSMPKEFWQYMGTKESPFKEGDEINLAKAYFIANNLLEGQYNRMMIGDYYLHDNKSKTGTVDAASASRYVSQIKRMVIYGATTHTYAQGLKDGVPKKVKVACIADLQSAVQNIVGETNDMDSCDGSGLTNPYYSRMENRSLLDAGVGDVKKTIMHDIGTNGVPKLLKWAEYAITNRKRRDSWRSDVRYETIFKNMNSEKLSPMDLEYSKVFENVFYFKPELNKHYKATVTIFYDEDSKSNVAYIQEIEVDSKGEPVNNLNINEVVPNKKPIETLYDLDQVLGGAWSESLNSNGYLEYSEDSLDKAFEVIVDNDWRTKMIGIVANKSALKVGIENLNDSSSWTKDTKLHTFEMSTEFGGLQMDADHELDDADVTEMTQMISALVQNGFSMEIAEKIYSDIGKYCAQSVEEISKAIGSKEELHKIFGKAMVEAFATGEKDTLGLAQAFIAIASKNMQEAGVGYIPFSSSSINGIFNATVTTSIVKKAIRRHYSGVAAVLNPAFGSIQVFNVGGKIYKYTELPKWLDKNKGFKTENGISWSLSELFDLSERSNGTVNPTFKLIDETTYLDFEDTITFKHPEKGWLSLKITDYKSYWDARRTVKKMLEGGVKVYIKQLAPKNLKGADTKFTLATTDGTGATATRNSSMFETVYAQLLYATYNIKANTTEDVVNQVKATLADLLGATNDAAWEETFNVKYKNILVNAFGNLGMNSEYSYKRLRRRLAKSQQKFLGELHKAQENISESDPIYTFNMDGAEYNISAVEVVPAQIIMGRYYAKQFGLTSQDNIEDILENKDFFFEKTKQNYINDIDSNPFDLTLYDGNGDQIHVMFDPKGTKVGRFGNSLSRFNEFVIVNGEVFYKEKLFCKAGDNEFYTYNVGDEAHKVIVVKNLNDLSSVIKNNWTDYSECHYNSENAKWLLENVNGLTITDNVVTLKGKKDGVEYTYDVNITTSEGLVQLNDYSRKSKNSYIGRISYFKHDSFRKSLNFIGTRIPCQSMQSFAPMRVVAFSDSELNEVFVPTNIMWLEGSDLDIDKQYILGYTVSDTGRIFSGDLEHHKEDCLKNNVVENIWKTVTDPRNQINLTQPISTDDMKALAATSHKGGLAEKMSYYNPFHKYSMQVENMVGKDCIGNVATAIKGFFALTYMYNTRMNEMCDAIESGNIDEAERLFNRYFKQPLANVNVERLDYVLTLLPEGGFKNRLLALKDKIEDQEDMSMLMGQLLNAATDNAKELILKKINADVNWIDMYTSAFMVGETLDTVGATMLNPITEAVLDIFDSSFLQESNFSKIGYLKGLQTGLKAKIISGNPKVNALLGMGLKDPEGNAYEKEHIADHVDEMLRRAEAAEETRILGRFLKINQGLYTNRAEMHAYLLDIKTYFERIYCESNPKFDAIKRISRTLSNSKLNLQLLVDGVENIKDKKTHDWYATVWDSLGEDLFILGKVVPNFAPNHADNLKQFISNVLMDDDNRKLFNDEISTMMSKIVKNCRFNVIKFASDENYRSEQIEKYEDVKKQFNILEAVATSPHFNQMFSMVSINEAILTEMSVRNALEDMVIEEYDWKRRMDGNTFKLGKTAIKSLQRRVDEVLRNEWIFGIEDLAIPVSKGQVYWNGSKYVKAEKDMSVGILVQTPSDINTLRYYIEQVLIPGMISDPNLSDNKFLQNMSFGEKAGVPFWKPTLNMSTIGQSVKTQAQYEELLNDFEKLYDVKKAGIRFVDWLYLYNMIVHQDKMGSNTFTRFFEGLVGRGVKSYAYDYSKWIDTADVSAIYSRNEAQLLRFADEEPEVDDSYVKHFKYNSKIEIEIDSNDEWDTLAKEAKLSEKELEICKQRADQLYVLNVSPTEVGVPTKLDLEDGFCNGGSQVVLMRKGFDNQFAKLKVGDVIAINDMMFKVEKPLMKAFSDNELEQVGVQKVEPIAPKSVVNMSEPSNFHAFSGAADGADTKWKEIAKLWGIDTTDYTVESYDALDSNWKNIIEEAYQKAVKDLGRFAYGPNTVSGKLVRRDYLQARKADAVFAVGKIVAPGEVGLPNSSGKAYENKTSHDVVDGGTGYAVQMAINMGKPVHVFDPYQEEWFIWNGSSFVRERTPVLTPKFAAIGSRRLTSDPKWIMGEVAIRKVFAETAKKYGWNTNRDTDLISFNSFEEMVANHNKVPNGIITTREANTKYYYGNPFTHRTDTSATIILPTVKDAVSAYRAWLLGETTFTTSEGKTIDISNVEPERRKWIQNQISSGALDGKTLIYYTTKIGSPNGYKTPDGKAPVYFSDEYPSHAHVLKELINSRSSSNGGHDNIDSNISAETLQQVELIFARNPKLKEVGTPLEYARYIQTIYPNSVDKSVYWHGSDSDFSEGFKTATRGEGSGSPHTKSRNDFYLAKQAWTVLQYVSGVNRKSADKKHGFANWVKLWWELKEIMSNGRRENNDWKDLVIGPENVRQAIPNKAGVFNRDSGGENGKWLKERKADYGYENKSDKEFFEEILGVKWGVDTFNTWTQRNAEIFKSLQTSAKGIYPAVINVVNPIRETGQNTYYEEQRGLFTKAEKDGNDAILGAKTDNEFGSDVAVVFDTNNVYFLGTTEDVENFRAWKQSKDSGTTTWGSLEERKQIEDVAKANHTWLKAPDGKDSNLTPELWISVRTKAFKEWFGDWENDPENASKIVDENGEPLLVYHGGPKGITEFRHSTEDASNTGYGTYTNKATGESIPFDSNRTIFFSDNKYAAKSYAALTGLFEMKKLYNILDSFSISEDGKIFINRNTFSTEELIEGLYKIAEYIPEFKKYADFFSDRHKTHSRSQYTKEFANNFIDLIIKSRKTVGDWGSDHIMAQSDWENAIPKSRKFLNEYNNDEGIKRLIAGEIPSVLKDEYDILQNVQKARVARGQHELGNYSSTYLWFGNESRNVLVYDDGELVLWLPGKDVKVTELSEKELKSILDSFEVSLSASEDRLKNTRDYQRLFKNTFTYTCFLNVRRPFAFDYKGTHQGQGWMDSEQYTFGYIAARQVNKAINEGYDGVVYENVYDPHLANNFGVFDSSQIKIIDSPEVFDSVSQKWVSKTQEKTINIYAGTGENSELSNLAHRPFTPGDITIDGVWINYKDEFKNVEAAFQAAKVFFVDDQNLSYEDNRSNSQILYKLYSASGSEAKKLGKQIKGLDVEAWDKAAPEVMRFLLQKSFEQNPVAAKKLLDTGDAILTHTQDKSKWGTEFPKLLMEVRSSLKENKLNLIEVKYTPKGKTEQTYFVDKSTWQIFNSKGDEVFKHDAANAGADRNKIHALMYIALGQARTYKWKDGNIYTVHENGIVMTPTGHRYSDPIQESQIYRAAYPEKFTTQPIVPAETVEDKTQDGEIQLTRDQKVALDAIVDYVKSPLDLSSCAICINGFAGTGKTTLINYVLQELVDQGEWRTQSVVVSAVSHQATLNIFNKIHVPGAKIKPQTIASFNVSGKSDEGDNFSYNINDAMADKGPGEPNIMFVDEVSMLTTDDVKILLHHASNYGMKLVFIGDINQLPPIEKDPNTGQDILQSVVFDKKLPIKHVKLQERVRQGKDSPILEYSDQFRTEDRRDSSIKDTTIGKEGAVIFDGSSAEKYIECFKHAKENSLPYFIKVCVPNHTLRNTENTAIHKALFDDPDLQILPGENILLYGNSHPTEDSIDGFKFNLATLINYCNSQSLTVDSITNLGLKTYKFGNASITLDLVEITPKESAWGMSRPEPFVTCRTIREMHRLFGPKVNGQNGCIMAQIREYLNKKFGVTPYNNKTWDQRDPEVRLFHELETIVPLDYGYASTIHKAQGSTYDIVITPSYDKYFGQKDKMAYTAVTRARNVVVVQDSKHSFDGNILDVNKTIEDNRKAPKSDTTLSISPNPQKVSEETKAQVREFIQAINSPYLKEVTDEDLAGVDDFTADADGFVQDGVIYINTDRASIGTLIHELGHLYLGALKSDPNKRTTYYKILSEMHTDCDLWQEMQGNQFYANKRGSDFDEEIAARLIENYMSGGKMSYRDWLIAKRLVSLTDIDFKSLPKPEKMQWLSENYKIKQRVATLKNQLYEDEVIKDIDC